MRYSFEVTYRGLGEKTHNVYVISFSGIDRHKAYIEVIHAHKDHHKKWVLEGIRLLSEELEFPGVADKNATEIKDA